MRAARFARNGAKQLKTQDANDAKATFDSIYSKADPRDYFSELGALDYLIPDVARPIFRQVAGAWRKEHGRAGTILDLGSSYGINSALFRYPLTFDMVRRRYGRREMLSLPSEKLRAYDRAYFQSWPRVNSERIVVADVSKPAVTYAVDAGIADAAIAHDFENDAPPADVAKLLADVDLIFSTGVVGYITERTFKSILDANKRAPWVVTFCLRMFDYRPVASVLAKAGLVTEKLETATFVQRRFQNEHEAEDVLKVLRNRGLDPTGLEADGFLMAELFVSRPPAAAEALPLNDLVSVVSGRGLSQGPRLLKVQRDGATALTPIRP